MRRIAYYLHRSTSGKLIAKVLGSRPPRIGVRVYDSRGKLIGRVVDVIGPVRSPYIVIRPSNDVELRQYEELFIR